MSSSLRWIGWIALAVVLGLAAAMFFEERGPLEQRVLARAPEDAAMVAYAELGALRKSNLLGRLVRQRLLDSAGLAMVEPDVDAVAVAVRADEIVGLAAGRFPFALLRRYLEQQGGACPAPLDEQACSLAVGGGYVSVRGLEAGLLGFANGPRAGAADALATQQGGSPRLAARAREALDKGALVWVSIDPRRLAETMSDPPEGWTNLSLIARALMPAKMAAVDLEDDAGREAVRATLRAECGSEDEAVELSKMLGSLNQLLVTALRMGKDEGNHTWAQVLEREFVAETNGSGVAVSWLLPVDLLQEATAGKRE